MNCEKHQLQKCQKVCAVTLVGAMTLDLILIYDEHNQHWLNGNLQQVGSLDFVRIGANNFKVERVIELIK